MLHSLAIVMRGPLVVSNLVFRGSDDAFERFRRMDSSESRRSGHEKVVQTTRTRTTTSLRNGQTQEPILPDIEGEVVHC